MDTRPLSLPAVVFLAFTAPKVYELKQKEIDSVLQLANGKAKELYAQLDEKVLKSELPVGRQLQYQSS